jgi:hypothetical protein
VQTFTVEQRRARLARRHRLLPEERTDDVAAIADSLVALHSSDPVAVYLSATARMGHPSIAAVQDALYTDRSVVRHHAMRRTLWVATPDVVRLMHPAATLKLVGPEHRRTARFLADSGIDDPDAWLAKARDHVLQTLRDRGPMTARALGQLVPELRHRMVLAPGKKYSTTISAHTRVLLLLCLEGELMRTTPTGSWINSAYTYAATDSWLSGGIGTIPPRHAAAGLADRWLRAFGPATTTDLQWWTGWTVTMTRTALADCGAVEVGVVRPGGAEVGAAWVARDDDDTPERPPKSWVALLPGLDPTTMGWKQRDWYLPAECAGTFDRMGNAGPTVWVDGQVVGAWTQAPDGAIRTRLFVEVPKRAERAIAERARRLRAVVGDSRFTVRFPSPAQTALEPPAG